MPTKRCFLYVEAPPLPHPHPGEQVFPFCRIRKTKKKATQLADEVGLLTLFVCLKTAARIKRNRKTQQIKFKVRCHRFLYTLVLKDSDKADKLKQSLPPSTIPFLFFPFLPPLPFFSFSISFGEKTISPRIGFSPH